MADNIKYLPLLPHVSKGRIIHVTHQIPFEIHQNSNSGKESNDEANSWIIEARLNHHNAMYSGIQSLGVDYENLYIGWTGHIKTKNNENVNASSLANDQKEVLSSHLFREHQCIPLFLDNELITGHYYGYCKSILWPLFNYIIWNDATDGRKEKAQWNYYEAVNKKYAELIVKHYKPEDTIWIHDYHLLLVPSMVRSRLPKAKIGLFVHSPFPSSEIFRCLPKRQEVLKGMLGANLVGFQTYANARHFISTSTRVLGYESSPDGIEYDGHFCHVGTFPIGVDVNTIDTVRKTPEVVNTVKALKEIYGDKKILVGRDKIELVQSVLQKLAAFKKFLLTYPEWQNKVVYIQVTDATSISTADSIENEHKISDMVAHINGTYGNLEYTPVYHYHHQIQTYEYYALLSAADAALITAVRDGMNTASLEYVMCQQENHGSLIVSELSGTAGSMGSALLINPWDYKGVARVIQDAFLMCEEEKLSRHMQLLAHVKSNTSSFWAQSFTKMLLHACALSEQSRHTPRLNVDYLLDRYRYSTKRLLCFNLDVTFTTVRKAASKTASSWSSEIIEYLIKLCCDPKNEVWVLSGRDENALDSLFGRVIGLGLSAEHGSFIRYPNSKRWLNLTEHFDMSWKNDILEIFTYYTERTTGSFIEHKRNALTWHYRLADAEYGAFQAKECQNHLEQAILSKLPVEVFVGEKYLQVRPTLVNKGEVLKRLVVNQSYDFLMCCGDDRTDEEMFKVLQKSELLGYQKFAIIIGGSEGRKTQASWHLPSTESLVGCMSRLVKCSSLSAASTLK
ncbi:glycosyltransferase family 20-domain-containing protein [Mycotypha africana]|uniref:glycosyltransferase family 20-domain-containing protein n=1 Tax=Mycotypha africana TaxID=64632 RepID=UPI002301FAA7|nr:glycosyltransferase family 20-domain-containing protein [Mycotypha africana]KAI8970343.1 glycosyltransferase family 20-domain-containing protein [Mycotypha africana]